MYNFSNGNEMYLLLRKQMIIVEPQALVHFYINRLFLLITNNKQKYELSMNIV